MVPCRKKKMVPQKKQVVHQSADWFFPYLVDAVERQYGVNRTTKPAPVARGELPTEVQAAVDCLYERAKNSCHLGNESYGSMLYKVADDLEGWVRSLPEKMADALRANLPARKPAKKKAHPTKMASKKIVRTRGRLTLV